MWNYDKLANIDKTLLYLMCTICSILCAVVKFICCHFTCSWLTFVERVGKHILLKNFTVNIKPVRSGMVSPANVPFA